LKDNLQEIQDFIPITEDLFKQFETRYDCDFAILRFGIRDVGRSGVNAASCYIEHYPCKLHVIDVPKVKSQKNFEILLISQNDTLADMRRRICNSRATKNFRLWKMDRGSIPFKRFYKDFETQFKETQKIVVDGDLLDFNEQTIGSLRFTREDVLIIEHQIKSHREYAFEKKIDITMSNSDQDTVLTDNFGEPSIQSDADYHSSQFDELVSEESNQGVCGLVNLGNT